MYYCQGAAEDKGCEELHETATQLHLFEGDCNCIKAFQNVSLLRASSNGF